MVKAEAVLLEAGYVRVADCVSTDKDGKKLPPKPVYEKRAGKLVRRAMVSRMYVTFWRVVRPGQIEDLRSVFLDHLDDVRREAAGRGRAA